jgi:hypothetical protein
MTLDEVKKAIEEGKRVFWSSDNYEVIRDKSDRYLIYSHFNGYCMGLKNGQDYPFYLGKEEADEPTL